MVRIISVLSSLMTLAAMVGVGWGTLIKQQSANAPEAAAMAEPFAGARGLAPVRVEVSVLDPAPGEAEAGRLVQVTR